MSIDPALFDPALFDPAAITPETRAATDQLRAAAAGAREWWEVGVAETRAASDRGRGAFPPAAKSPRAREIAIPGAGAQRIVVRLLGPTRTDRPTGVYLFMHGGGLVFGAADHQDPTLERIARGTGMVCASVAYRLAPEHRYPAAWDDCEAVARWLVMYAKTELGTDVLTIGGESAGAQLAVATLVRMRDRHGYTGFRAANLAYGSYDASMTPSQRHGPAHGVVGPTSLRKYVEHYLPRGGGGSGGAVDPRDPDVSPLYAKLDRLPPALFTVGTHDPLLDDSLFMYARWLAAHNPAELALYPGGEHAFNLMPMPIAAEANARVDAFLAMATRPEPRAT